MGVVRSASVIRRLARCAGALSCLLAATSTAAAAPALVGVTDATELRVAYAKTPELTTLWTSVRIKDGAGPFALVLPLPDGAFVDQSSDAWFEALEVATAKRVFPPEGLSPFCPGASGPPNPFEIAGSVKHEASLPLETLALAGDAAEVAAWASAQGLAVSPELLNALEAVPAARLLCVKFTAPGGSAVTPTLRVSAPGGLPSLPFSITRAATSNLRVSAWLFGDGRGQLDGMATKSLPAAALTWNAKTLRSSYIPERDALLASDPAGASIESASHGALADATSIANGSATIEPLAATYFTRASEYGNAAANPAPCTSAAKTALAATSKVGPACPRGDLAALAGDCVPVAPGAGEVDPASLMCGPGADDLALALSGAVPAETWVTRRTFVIPQGSAGVDRTASFGSGAAVTAVTSAGSVDLGDCFGGAGGAGGSTSSNGGSGAGTTTSTPTTSGAGGAPAGSGSGGFGNNGQGNSGQGNSGQGNSGQGAFGGGDVYETDPYYIDTSGCSCGGPVDTGTSESIETFESSDPIDSDSSGGDDCGGDSSSSSDGGDSSGDDCGGDSSSSSSGTTSDGCGSDSTGTSDTTDSDCAVSRSTAAPRRRSGLRLSVLGFGAAVVLLPLRRRGTRKRRGA